MAGSDKLYLQPVLEDLLRDLSSAIGNIDTIVDGLATTLGTVKTTIETTNTKLDSVNATVGETGELGLFPAAITGKTPAATINETCWTDDMHRYQFSDASKRVVKFESFADGAFMITGSIKGEGGSNPGLSWKDLTTGVTTEILKNAQNDYTTETFSLSVEKGHSYELLADWTNGSTENDLFIQALSFTGYVYRLGSVATNTINVEIPE